MDRRMTDARRFASLRGEARRYIEDEDEDEWPALVERPEPAERSEIRERDGRPMASEPSARAPRAELDACG
jgi:hypothetical protein